MTTVTQTTAGRLGRNERCHCGSGRKYKQCCLEKDEAVARAASEKAAAETAPPPPEPVAEVRERKRFTAQPWKRSATNTQGFQRMSTPRKVGGG